MEANPVLHSQRRVPPRRLPEHPDATWCPNYGGIGPDGFLTWAPDRLESSGIIWKLHREFLQLLDQNGRAASEKAVAHQSAVVDLLDKIAPNHLPADANQQWWELRTHIATSSQDFLSWDDLASLLSGVIYTLSGRGTKSVQTPSIGSLAGAQTDMVCTTLLSLPVLNSSSAFAEARRLLKACGQELVQRQVLLDGLLEFRSNELGDLGPSLAEDSELSRVARLAAGISEHPRGMAEEQAALGSHRGSFVVALPGPGDPLPPWPPRRHRIIASRDCCSWASFDVLALGVFDGDIARAIQQVEALWVAAAAYTEASGWVRPAFFLRCYPRSDANIPHVHAVDLDPIGNGLPVMFGPWDLPLEDALAVLREESQVQAGVIPVRHGGLRAPIGSQDEFWNIRLRDAAGNLDMLQTAMQAARHVQDVQCKDARAHRDAWGHHQDVEEACVKIQSHWRGSQARADAARRRKESPASTWSFYYTSDSLLTHPSLGLSATEVELEEALRLLQEKLAKVRSTTFDAVAALSDHGRPGVRASAR